jgi:hypothetical protein
MQNDPQLGAKRTQSQRQAKHKRIRLFLLIILLGGLGWFIFPWLQELFQPEFEMAITSIHLPDDHQRCTPSPLTLGNRVSPTRHLCVCGYLYSNDAVSYSLRLRSEADESIETFRFRKQNEGAFCHQLDLDEMLPNGRYFIEITTLAAREPHTTHWFSIQPTTNP